LFSFIKINIEVVKIRV